MDSYVYEASITPSSGKDFVFENRIFVDVPDSNGGSYSSNKVTWALDNISNSGDSYFDAKQSMVLLPINLAVEFLQTAGTGSMMLSTGNTIANGFVASLKSGAYQIIDKINFKLNGNEVITLDNFENVKINYKILSQWSQDDYRKRADELHMGFDTPYTTTYDVYSGVQNVSLTDAAFDPTKGFKVGANKGRIQRMQRTSFSYAVTSGLVADNTDISRKFQDHYAVANVNPYTCCINFQILATFRLADLHPFFASMPLCKNPSMYLSLTLNTNQLVTQPIATGIVEQAAAGQATISNGTNTTPFQLSRPGSGYAIHGTAGQVNGTIKASIGCVRANAITNSTAHPMSQAQFRGCYVKMSPDYEMEFLKSPVKPVVWEDCYCQYGSGLTNVAANGQVNQLISGSFSKLRKIVILPFLSASANAAISPLQSVYAAEPGTCSSAFISNAAISNLNARVGVNNVYPANIQYTYQNYLESVQGDGAINGSLSQGITSGLISQSDWECGYGFRVIDLSRKPEVNDLSVQSVSVQFQNLSGSVCDYLVLVYYEKSCALDCARGLIVL